MHLIYTHGLGGTSRAQPEIEEVFAPLGYTITRIEVPYHSSPAELALTMLTMTFGDLCLLIHETADTWLRLFCWHVQLGRQWGAENSGAQGHLWTVRFPERVCTHQYLPARPLSQSQTPADPRR